jgi:hypothetical protein
MAKGTKIFMTDDLFANNVIYTVAGEAIGFALEQPLHVVAFA